MVPSIRVDDLLHDPAEPCRKLWGMVLLMAIRDKAASVHYHPWRPAPLLYLVGYTRHDLVPPPAAIAGRLVVVARELFAPRPGPLGRLIRRRPAAVSGAFRLRLETDDGASEVEWTGVCWEAGGRAGVDLYQVAVATAEPALDPELAADGERDGP